MPAKVIVSGFLLVVMVVMLIFTVEFFLPLSAKSDMNAICRSTLLEMECSGGMSNTMNNNLKAVLENKGFNNIRVEGTTNAKQGSELKLRVELDYSYSRMASVFSREAYTQHMIYDKTAMSRRVIN